MSTPSSSDLLSSYQQQITSLQTELAQTKAQKEGLARIATQALSLLSSLDDKVRPQGFWAQEGDQTQIKELEGSSVLLDTGKAWEWCKIAKSTAILPRFPLIETYFTCTRPRPEIVPFKASFPLEILERIVTLSGRQTIALFAQSSLACLEIFAPKILRRAVIGKYGSLSKLFVNRDLAAFPRLTQSLSLQLIRVLDIPASTLEHIYSKVSTSRFAPGDPVLRLKKLVVNMGNAVNHPCPPSDGYDSEWGEEDDEQGPTFRTFEPKSELLSLLDPEYVVFQRKNPLENVFDDPYSFLRGSRECDERMYRITRAGAMAISSWSRLSFVDLVDMDLFVLDPQTLPDDELARTRDQAVDEDPKSFFLGLGGSKEIVEELSSTNASLEWNVRWLVNYGDKSAPVKPFERGWKSLPSQLVNRDYTLTTERIKSAVIVVHPGSKDTVEAQVAETKEEERGPLRAVA